MKVLINKENPEIRITAPEIRDGKYTYMVDYISGHDSENKHHTFYLWKESWTLVEEEQEVEFKVEERKWVHNAVDNVFPEDGDFMSEVDFRKIIKDTARHFYELGRIAQIEQNKALADMHKSPKKKE